MGYFDNIFPGLAQDGDPEKAKAYVPQGWKVRKPGKDYWQNDETFADEGDELRPPDERGSEPSPEKPDVKLKVRQAHTDIEAAFGAALKVLKDKPHTDATYTEDPLPSNVPRVGPQDYDDLEAALVRAQKRDNPIKLADDLRTIASRSTVDPQYAKALHGAADKLTKAYQAQGELESLRQPGGPLAITPQEVEGRKQYLAGEIQRHEEQMKTAGALRAPELQTNLKKLREEEGRVNLVTQPPPRDAAVAAPSPEDPAGDGRPIESNFRALGIKKPHMVNSFVEALNALGIDSEGLDETVPFDTAMLRVLSTLDPQASLARRAVSDPDLAGPPPGQEMTQGAPGEMGQIPPKDLEMRDKKARIRQLYQELGTSPFGNTWIGLIAYVFLGLLMGPKMAARILSKRNDGALRGEIEYLKADIREEMANRERADRERQEYRKMYVQHHLLSQRQKADDQRAFRQQFMMTYIRGQQALQRAMMSKKASKDPVLTGLQEDFRNATNMAGKFSQAMDIEQAAKWNKRAEALIPLIQQRRAQLGTTEEPEEKEPEE